MSEMFITPIRPMHIAPEIGQPQRTGAGTGVSLFRSVFENAAGDVKATEEELVNQQFLLATGQVEDAHSVLIAASNAQMAVDMLVSLRNKALDAYNEIIRINL